ncbi:MAG: DUF6744 family protein [Thermodesulfobacteriota bacterium]
MEKRFELEKVKGQYQNFPKIGDIVWWSLSNIKVRRDDIENMFRQVGLGENYLPAVITNDSAYRKAIKYNRKVSDPQLLRLILDDSDIIVHGIVNEKADMENMNLDYALEARVSLDKGTGVFHSTTETDKTKKIHEDYDFYMLYYTTDDVRSIVVRVIRSLNPTVIREGGGVYFVPVTYEDTVKKLEQLIPMMSWSSVVYSLPIIDTEKTRKNIFAVYTTQVEKEIERVVAELEGFDNPTVDVLKNRVEKFNAIRLKAEMYEDLIKMSADGIRSRIDSAVDAVTKIMLGTKGDAEQCSLSIGNVAGGAL